jgi:tetratricopeptide (TPR) repeat protein
MGRAVVVVASELTSDWQFPGPADPFPLAAGLLRRALVSGDNELLSSTIASCRSTLESTPGEDRMALAQTMRVLGVALQHRFRRHGAMADIDEAIEVGQRGADLASEGQPEQLAILVSLAVALRLRFDREGVILGRRDLDAAVTTLRRAAASPPKGSQRAARIGYSLCTTLRVRFEHYGDPADLAECIAIGRELIATAPAADPIRARTQVCQGLALFSRFGREAQAEDLGEALAVLRQALALLPEGHEDRPVAVAGLAAALSAHTHRNAAGSA